MNYSGKIRQLRESKGLTQEEMAMKLNLSTDGYGKIERGQTQWNAKRMEQIAKVLEVPLWELLPDVFGDGTVVQISEGTYAHHHGNNYYNGSSELAMKIEMLSERIAQLEMMLHQKDEMITQQKQLIEVLNNMVATQKSNQKSDKLDVNW